MAVISLKTEVFWRQCTWKLLLVVDCMFKKMFVRDVYLLTRTIFQGLISGTGPLSLGLLLRSVQLKVKLS